MPVGLYRFRGELFEPMVCVEYADGKNVSMFERRYRENGYKPPIEELPTKDQYDAKATDKK